MSALWAPASDRRDGPAPAERERRPSLRAVPRAMPRLARVPFLLVLIALFGMGMTGLLMLNTTLQNQAFQVSTLNRQATELAYTQADLEARLDRVAAPQVLAERATALGLRANPHPALLVLPQGKVVGKPQPVVGNEVPIMIVKTPAQLAAERSAAAARKQAQAAQQQATAARKAALARQAAAARALTEARAAEATKAQQAAARKAAAEAAEKAAKKKSSTGGRG